MLFSPCVYCYIYASLALHLRIMKKNYSQVAYHNAIFRIIISLLAAAFFVLYGSGLSVFEALLMKDFYRSLIGSFIIALILVHGVHVATLIMDKTTSWQSNALGRILMQTVFGFAVPCVLAYLLAALYFRIHGLEINTETKYLKYIYPLVVFMLCTLNIYYLIHSFMLQSGLTVQGLLFNLNQYQQENKDASKQTGSDTKEELDLNTLQVSSGAKQIQLDVSKEVCFFYHSGNLNWGLTFEDATHIIPRSLTELEKQYCGAAFIRINQQVIINRNVISCYSDGSSHRTLSLTLKPEYVHLAKNERFLYVSRKNFLPFKSWFAR